VQKRIKDHKYSNADYPHKNKIDITIVVDMLLTGFDSKYLNTLYVDKNLKNHGLIQAFSRTNRILNDTKPYGNIRDFRRQQTEVDDAIALFSGEEVAARAKEIWLVDPAPTVIKKFEKALTDLNKFMQSHGLACTPEEVSNLNGDIARAEFINRFKEVQRYKTQLNQYTDLEDKDKSKIDNLLPDDQLRAFRSVYLDTAKRLKAQQDKKDKEAPPEVQQLDFEFVLFASAIIDYDYIMGLIAKYTQREPSKQKMTREQLINVLNASANLMDERDDIAEYINTLETGTGLNEKEIKDGYLRFKAEKLAKELAATSTKYGLAATALQAFVDDIITRMVFDGDNLTDLMEPLGLRWKERAAREVALMQDLIPVLKKLAQGRDISGLSAYEE
jgi:type I restriction enzyme R subunit